MLHAITGGERTLFFSSLSYLNEATEILEAVPLELLGLGHFLTPSSTENRTRANFLNSLFFRIGT